MRPARWRASSCRPKIGGALKTSHTHRLDHVRAHCHAGPSVDGTGRASTVPVAALACAARQAARARLVRQQRRLEVDESRKRDAQTGAPTGGPRVGGGSRWHRYSHKLPHNSQRGVVVGQLVENSSRSRSLHSYLCVPTHLPVLFAFWVSAIDRRLAKKSKVCAHRAAITKCRSPLAAHVWPPLFSHELL